MNNNKLKGFIIKLNKSTAEPNHYTKTYTNLYLKAYKSYTFNKIETCYMLEWTAYKNEALVFTDRLNAIKLRKSLQATNKAYSIKPSYTILTYKQLKNN